MTDIEIKWRIKFRTNVRTKPIYSLIGNDLHIFGWDGYGNYHGGCNKLTIMNMSL